MVEGRGGGGGGRGSWKVTRELGGNGGGGGGSGRFGTIFSVFVCLSFNQSEFKYYHLIVLCNDFVWIRR